MAEQNSAPESSANDATRRELFQKLGAAAYIAPATLVLLSSQRANAY